MVDRGQRLLLLGKESKIFHEESRRVANFNRKGSPEPVVDSSSRRVGEEVCRFTFCFGESPWPDAQKRCRRGLMTRDSNGRF
jgi:hypothetical protein